MTIITAMVSPMARPMAKIMDSSMFFHDPGRTMVATICHLEIPRTSAAG